MMRRGFTLVELMVALAAGIAVAGAAYLLSKSSMEVFNQEARLSSAQFAATMGMNRMVADLQRAGFQMSPNIQADVAKRCGDAASTVPHANLKAIQILRGRSAAWATGDVQAAMTAAGVNPDVIRIAGNFSTSEQYEFRTIQDKQVSIAMVRGSMQRTLRDALLGGRLIAANLAAPFPDQPPIFQIGGWVRIVDGNGRENYRKVTAVDCGGDCMDPALTLITLTLDQAPNTDASCGPGASRGLINPVSIIDYWVGNPTFAGHRLGTVGGSGIDSAEGVITPCALAPCPLGGPGDPQTGELSRAELVRSERLDADGLATTLDASTAVGTYLNSEVVSEYIVDLAAGATIRQLPPLPLKRYDPGDALLDAAVPANPGALPQRFVSLQVRLSARSRVPDREAPIIGSPNGRYDVFGGSARTVGTTSRFARVRTFSMEIHLPNLASATW